MMSKLEVRLRNTILEDDEFISTANSGGSLATKSYPTATPWTVTHQAPLSMGFSRQEYWSRLPFSSSGDLPDPGMEPRSPALQADSLPSELPGKPRGRWQVPICS